MTKLLTVVFISFTLVIGSSAQESNPKRFALGIYGGIQIPGGGEHPKLSTGPWIGITANIATGLGWCIQFEYNFWKATNKSREPDEDLYVSEFPILFGYKWDFDKYYLQTLAGLGMGSSGNTLFGDDKDILVSFEVALKFGLVITKDADVFVQVRKQWSASPGYGGEGSAFTPWFVGLGYQIKLF